ncbi:MAG: hypothetical protein RLZZ182_2735 [Pseudomonadota bacterium]
MTHPTHERATQVSHTDLATLAAAGAARALQARELPPEATQQVSGGLSGIDVLRMKFDPNYFPLGKINPIVLGGLQQQINPVALNTAVIGR